MSFITWIKSLIPTRHLNQSHVNSLVLFSGFLDNLPAGESLDVRYTETEFHVEVR